VSRIDYQSLIVSLVRDEEEKITPDERDRALQLAVERYSKDRPREVVEDLAGQDSKQLPLPTAWENGFSSLINIEYPIGNWPPTYIEPGYYGMYNAPGAQVIMVSASIPSTDSVRCTHTIRHQVTDTVDSTPASDNEAIASYAAALLCDQLASQYSGDTDTTIQADSVEHSSKARDFATRANSLRKRYYDHLGIDPKRTQAAGVVVDLDMPNSLGNDRLTHPNRWR
jgi:hypothetical protein